MTNGPRIRDILFPTDFSGASAAAGRTAIQFARHFGAALHVLHVVPPGFDVEAARTTLAKAAASLASDLTITPRIEAGLGAPAIVAYARAHGIDLIVMGTHGRTGFSHVLLGSVAEAVVRRAPCPVLTVPDAPAATEATAEAPPSTPGRCIVCTHTSVDLICSACRTRIRGEVLEQKRTGERAGRIAAR